MAPLNLNPGKGTDSRNYNSVNDLHENKQEKPQRIKGKTNASNKGYDIGSRSKNTTAGPKS